MSQQILKVRPTKIELIRLRRRIKVARRLHKVLKDRLIILSQELIALVKEARSLRLEIHDEVVKCEQMLMDSTAYTTPLVLEALVNTRIEKSEAVVGTRVVAGVKVPLLEFEKEKRDYDVGIYSATLEEAGKCYESLIDKVLRLAEMEASIILIGKEVSRVKRRVNALENILIPKIEATIKYLRMKFEEREREDKTRMKKVKQLLAKKR